jgi:hypothetical protein
VIAEYKPVFFMTNDGKKLIAKRTFFFGGGNYIMFPVAAYSQVKTFFDSLNKSDNHTITLRQWATAAAAPQ